MQWIASFSEPDFVVPLLVFSIPVIAIAGGIVHGIVRSIGQQRMLEMAQRERIAAIERGFDPSKLPPFPMGGEREDWGLDSQLRRFQGLLIGGIVLVFVGFGLLVFLHLIQPNDMIWAVALIATGILTVAA